MKPVLLIFMIILAIDMSPFGSPSHAEANSSSDIERHKKDIESYKLELETSPDSGEIRKKLAAYYLTAARVMIDRGRYEEALHLLDEGEKYQREERKLKFLRGLAYFRMKSYFEAESELVSIAYEGNGYPEALKLLGWLYYDMANLRGAIDVWRQALDLEPGDGQLESLIAKTRKEYLHEESLSTGFTGRFLLQYDGERDEATGEKVLEILEDAYQDVGSDLNHYPEGDIVVILYTNREFKDITMAPEWVGGIYDGKIRLPVGGIKGPAQLLRPLLYHEYTHVVINSATKGNWPAWLNEGLAVLEEEKAPLHIPEKILPDL